MLYEGFNFKKFLFLFFDWQLLTFKKKLKTVPFICLLYNAFHVIEIFAFYNK